MANPTEPGRSSSSAALTAAADRRFGLHVALPIAALTIGASILLVGAVCWAAHVQDRYSVAASRQVLRGAIDSRREFLADEVADDAAWDEAFQELHEGPNGATLAASTDERTNGTAGVDATLVIAPNDKVIYATENGAPVGAAVGLGVPAGLSRLVAAVRSGHDGGPLTGLALFAGQPAIASAAVVRREGVSASDMPKSLLVFIDLLDQPLLSRFARDFGLANLHWQEPGEATPPTSLALESGNEASLGTLAWRVDLPGTAMLRETAPALAGAVVAFGLLTAIVLGRARRTAHLLHVAQTQATHDPLTGLPNRLLLMDRLDQAMARIRREPGEVAVLYLDLDGFKAVNDRFGHAHGDAVLIETARRLRRCARESDTVARLGGDEFAVVQSAGIQPEAAEALCRRLLEALSAPMVIGGREVEVGASVGAAFGPGDATDPAQLLRLADKALYMAKGSGRGTFRLFDREQPTAVAAVPRPTISWTTPVEIPR
jgi:diguanylate cyclase (GGDEF)-like protein